MKKNKKENTQTFEDAFNELKITVEKIEKTDNNLENMVALIERGMFLSEYCQNKINKVYEKIELIKSKYDKNEEIL